MQNMLDQWKTKMLVMNSVQENKKESIVKIKVFFTYHLIDF